MRQVTKTFQVVQVERLRCRLYICSRIKTEAREGTNFLVSVGRKTKIENDWEAVAFASLTTCTLREKVNSQLQGVIMNAISTAQLSRQVLQF